MFFKVGFAVLNSVKSTPKELITVRPCPCTCHKFFSVGLLITEKNSYAMFLCQPQTSCSKISSISPDRYAICKMRLK